ncbi:ABC transporter substrate-binding protein [Phycicoccus ginsengisoli]
MRRSSHFLIASAATATLLLAACGSANDGAQPASAKQEKQAKQVSYLTSFNTFGRDAYVYVAQEKGFFAAEGLKVDIKPGTGTVDVLKLVASGRSDFGIGDFTTTVVTVAKEKLPVTAVAAIQQKSLAAIVTLEKNGIAAPKDLENKTIGDQPGSTNQVIFPVYAKAAGIDASKVKFVPSAPPALPQLLASGRVDAIGQFVVAKGLIESAAKGEKAVFLPFGDVLPDLYGNALVTSKDFLKSNPEAVSSFRKALLKGLEYSIAHPDETGTILAKYQPTQNPKVAAGEVTAMAPYVTGTGSAVGALEKDRVTKTINILSQAGAVPSGFTADQVADFTASGR